MATPTDTVTTQLSYRRLLTDARLVIIALVSFTGIMGATVVQPALAGIANGLSVSDARVGLVMTAYFVPSIFTVPLVGALADIYGRRSIVLSSLFLFGAGGTAIFFADSFPAVLALRAIQGIGFAGLTPLSIALVGDLYSGPEGSAAQGIRVSFGSFNSVFVPSVAGFLAGIAWNVPFLFYGLAFPMMLLVYRFLPETGAQEAVTTDDNIVDEVLTYWEALRDELRDATLAVLIAGGFVGFFVKHATLTFLPLYAVRILGADVFLAGILLSVRGTVELFVAPTSGRLLSRFPRESVLLGSLAVAGLAVSLVPFAPTIVALGLVVALFSVGNALFTSVLNDSVSSMASPDRRGGVVSGMNAFKMVANGAAPAVFGVVLAVAGFDAVFWLAAATGLAYFAIAAAILARSPTFRTA